MTRRFGVRLYAYVLMDNHYHLLLELTESNLSRAVQWLNVSYSIWFNRRHRRSGHLFQQDFRGGQDFRGVHILNFYILTQLAPRESNITV